MVLKWYCIYNLPTDDVKSEVPKSYYVSNSYYLPCK